MDRLIPIINKLQDVFATVGSQPIDLPQIAVVGSQSVGKSSVLENIVGRDFLPRGSDIVTRRPLILQLFNTTHLDDLEKNKGRDDEKESSASSSSSSPDTWGEFLHSGSKKYYDFNEIRKEIDKETERVAPNKAISYEPINLKIYSPTVLNLTLIDLPGMTKVAVANQPPDIERRIRKLIRSFISRQRCLILAVSAATSDLATSDAIQLAREVDPKGVRTLGVITKIDLMDQGTNALKILRGEVIPLQLGYVGVVNRSQKDINDRKPINMAQSAEKLFFKNHAAYRSMAHVLGTPYLAYKLNQILINHIKKCLPDLRQSIHDNIQDLETEIISYGRPITMDNDMNNNKGALLLHLISKFSENFSNSIDGANVNTLMMRKKSERLRMMEADDLSVSQQARELFGGARILYIFRTEFTHNLGKIKPFDGLSDQFILNSMRNASGIRSSLFIPEMCFENLVKMQIEKLRRPCMQCVDLVFAELKRIGAQSETTEIARFEKFRKALNDTVTAMLKRHLNPCRQFVNEVIDIELAYVNTNHPDFISMDDVFTERANHHSQAEMYKQVANDSEEEMEMNHSKAAAKRGAVKQSHGSHIATDNSQRVKSAPSPPHSSPPNSGTNNQVSGGSGAGGGGKSGWFGFGRGGNTNPNTKSNQKGDSNNPFHNESESAAIQQQQQQQQQQQMQQQQQQRREQQRRKKASSGQQKRGSSFAGNSSYVQTNATQREQLELLVIKRFIRSYFGIVKKNIADLVPKSIMFMLVNKSKQRLQQDLALALYKEDQFESLLSESPEIARKRKAAQDLLAILQKALQIINEVNDYRIESRMKN